MSFHRSTAEIFALIFLLFVNFTIANSQNSIYQLEPGAKIRASMDNEISSEVAGVNDTFTATLTEPIKVRETIILPIGTVIEGRILKVERAKSGRKVGSLSVRFEMIRFENGERREIEGILVNELKAGSTSKSTILTVIGGTIAGVLIGGISKSATGAILGAGIGTGAGAVVALAGKGKNVRIKTDEKFEIELTKQVILPVRDY